MNFRKLFSLLVITILVFVVTSISVSQIEVTPDPQNYPSLNSAFTAIEAGDHGLTPTVTYNSSFADLPATLDSGAYSTVTITTSVHVIITYSGTAPYITFNNVDNSVIYSNSGRSLTINLTNAATMNGIILTNGSSGNVIKDISVRQTVGVSARLIHIAQSTT